MRRAVGATGMLTVLAGATAFPIQARSFTQAIGTPFYYDFALGLVCAGIAFAGFAARRFLLIRLASGILVALGSIGVCHAFGFFAGLIESQRRTSSITEDFEYPVGLILMGIAFFSLSARTENKRR